MWKGIQVNDYGMVGIITLKQNGVAANISSYTTVQYILQKPSYESITKTAALYTDGTDGKVTYTFADGDIDEAGVWKLQVRLSKTGSEITSEESIFIVGERLDE